MRRNSLCIGNGLVAALVLACWNSAWGGEHQRSGKVETSGGRTAGFQQEIDRTREAKDRTTTVQGQDGVWNRNVRESGDRRAGTANRSAVTTMPNGKTAATQESAVRNGNSVDVTGSRTGFDGKSSYWNQTLTRTGKGTVDGQGQYTRQNGNTIDTSSATVRTADGHVTSGTYTASTGKSGTFSDEIVNSDGTRTRTQTITSSGGQSADRVVETTRAGDTIDRTVTATGSNGKTETHSETVTLDK